GTYALFLALDKAGPWTWIFSTNPGWGSYQYDPKNDALRVSVSPQDAPYTEFMTFGFDERKPDSALAYLQWEKKRVPLRIQVPNVNDIYVAEMRRELQGWPGFNYQNWETAAQFCASHKVNLEEALVWADRAIHEPFRGAAIGREEFSTYQTKAAVLEAMGKTGEADSVMDKAFTLPGADLLPVVGYGVGLLRAGRAQKAIEVLQLNQKRHPEDKFWNNLGLARAYTAAGQKQKAIESWETLLKNVPENRKYLIPVYEKSLKDLKGGS